LSPTRDTPAAGGPTADPWKGRVIAGRFQLMRKLGDGGMGEVYLAEQQPMGRMVALKVLRSGLAEDPNQVERFKREAQAISRLQHPNTVIVHDFGQSPDGTLFIAMEYLEGETLASVLEREGRIDATRMRHVFSQICGSLAEAHEQRIVHRDLKPENIFLTTRGGVKDFVKVLDFGIAKVNDTATGGKLETLTRAGAIFGTPQYMSPEQIKGGDLDARADVYALGVMLYQVLAGHLPWQAATAVEMLTKHLAEAPAPLSLPTVEARLAARLEAVAMRALSKKREDRPASVPAFMTELNAAFEPATGMSAPPAPQGVALQETAEATQATRGASAATQVAPPRSKPSGVIMAIGAAALVVGALAAWMLTGNSQQTVTDAPGAAASVATPTAAPTAPPTAAPSAAPTVPPTVAPTAVPTAAPTMPRTLPRIVVPSTAAPPRIPRIVPATVAPHFPKLPPRPATVIVTSRTRGLTVLVNGRVQGRTPLPNFTLPTGQHRITAKNGNKVVFTQSIQVKSGSTTRLALP
jgi:serine/threonine-protein kinase